jgi:hypothetical protein
MATDTVGKKEPVATKNLFGKPKEATAVIYRMIHENKRKRPDTPRFPPYKRFPNYDVIVEETGTRAIRWLPGEKSIYVDEQEANGRVIPESTLNNPNNRFEIIDGDVNVKPHEKTKIEFLDKCNRNADSKHRTGKQEAIFAKYTPDREAKELVELLNKKAEAMKLAQSADDDQLVYHVNELKIRLIDDETGQSREESAIRADYLAVAIDDPKRFLDTFDNDELKDKAAIKRAIAKQIISVALIPGKIAWTEINEAICDLEAGKAPVETLYALGKTKAGAAMMKRLREL